MVKVFLHIGMHKTGSSAIQRAFYGFNDGKFAYADLGFENHSIPIYTAFSNHYQNYHIWKGQGLGVAEIENRRATALKKLHRALKRPKAENLIISGEDISLLQRRAVEELAQVLRTYNADVQILGYFRDPVSFLSSTYQQAVKLGLTRLTVEQPRYQFRFGKFIRIFGRQAVSLRHFAPHKFSSGDVVTDFCKWIGIEARPKQSSAENVSLSEFATKALFLMDSNNVVTRGDPKRMNARQAMAGALSELLPGRFKLPDSVISRAHDERDIAWMEQNGRIDFGLEHLAGDAAREAYVTDLRNFMSNFPESATHQIAQHLQQKGVEVHSSHTAVDLLKRLFEHETHAK